MTKRWKAGMAAGYAAALGTAGVVMWGDRQSNQRIEATHDTALPTPAEPVARTADINGDGRVELDDILLVIHAFKSEDDCESPCLADICCCGPHVIDLDDILAVLTAMTGETVICPPIECVTPSKQISVECENADGVLVPVEPNADGEIAIMEDQRCVYTAVPAAEPGD